MYLIDSKLYDCPSFRLNVDPHDSLVQQLVSEAWLRIDRYDCITLFFLSSVCFELMRCRAAANYHFHLFINLAILFSINQVSLVPTNSPKPQNIKYTII